MKKALAILAALTLTAGMASCGETGNSTADSAETVTASTESTTDSTVTETAANTSTAAVSDTTAATTAAADAYAGHREVKLQNDVFGVAANFSVPEFVNWTEKQYTRNPSETEFNYKAYYSESSYINIDFDVSIMSVNSLAGYKKRNPELPNTEYDGYIEDNSNDRTKIMHFYGADYLDGKQYARVRLSDNDGKMSDADFAALVEEVQKTLRFTDTGAKQIYAANGWFLNTKGLLSYPTEMTIAGVQVKTEMRAVTRDAHVTAEFTDADGQQVTVNEAGYTNATAWEKYMDTNKKNSPFECKIGGYTAKGYLFQEQKKLHACFAIQLDEKNNLNVNADLVTNMEISDLLAKMDGAGREELNKKMTAYVNDFISASAVVTATGAAAAVTTTAASATTAAVSASAAQTTQTSSTNAGTANKDGYSDQDLEFYARRYYGLHTNYSPEHAAVSRNADGTASIQLYDSFSDHNSTCAWYTVNVRTGEGEDALGNKFNLTDTTSEIWMPERDIYGVTDGEYARILYLGKMTPGSELNPMTLQSLINNTVGVREYVNHFDYINSIPETQMFSSYDGEYVFMIIPAEYDATIRIDRASSESSGMETVTRTYTASPVILRCNKGGKSDVKVYITDQRGEHSFSPKLKNGWSTDCGGEKVEDLAYPFD